MTHAALIIAILLAGAAAAQEPAPPVSTDRPPPIASAPPRRPGSQIDPTLLPPPAAAAPVPDRHPSELDPAPPGADIDPPDSGLEVTPGHEIRGCIQVPTTYQPRGPYTEVQWPFGVIPYEFDGNVTQTNRNLMLAAMSEIESMAAIDFRPREQFDPSWLHIQNSSANNSPVGIRPGEMIVNINAWTTRYVMVHELFHSMGVYHEQSRTDRDNYVTINYGNICQNCCPDGQGNQTGGSCNFNFDIENMSSTYGLYNFDSIMHYNRAAWTSGTDSITVLGGNNAVWQNRIGQRDHLSFGDRSTLIRMYQPGWAKVAKINSNPNGPGTFASPYNNFPDAYSNAPNGGDVLVEPGYYTGLGFRNRNMRIHAPNGGVRIGQ